MRDWLHRQIDRLPPGKLRFVEQFLSMLEEDEPVNTVKEDTTEYPSREETGMAPVASAKK